VVATGSDAEILDLADEETMAFDLEGAWVIPGLTDAHAHLYNLGLSLTRVDLRGTVSAADCVERAREMERCLADGAWLGGRAWDQNDWADQIFPTRDILDAAFGDRPVYFRRVDGHAAWVSSATLALAGIDATTPDPEGGEILRDSEGVPTGILVDNAEDLVSDILTEPGPEEIERVYRRGLEDVHRHGITGVHEMGSSVAKIDVLRAGEREGWLKLRLVCYIGGPDELAGYAGSPVRGNPAARLWVDGVKLYADGALGSRGAALITDYSDRAGHRGLLIQSPDELQIQAGAGMARDFTVVIHAIGDRGTRVSLDAILGAYSELGTERPLREFRPRIEHAQIVAPDDFARFARHGIIPSMQPTHCTSDMPWAPQRLGEQRIQGAYAWRTMLDLDLLLPLGSDFPVEKTSPWLGLYSARTRHSVETGERWSPEQALSPLEALLGFTVWPAQTIRAEGWGRLATGYRADLVIVDHDPLGEDASELLETSVELTMVDGEIVYTPRGGRFSSR
jgi:predicted amidohydrolase YtcJ